ncbi:GNAT family N-acetyltransferase [Paenibacillus sediminis]|uniref:Ribosomal-protein-alanine N-acetyltransferase n=1 Tax=Paenibacillus sediminis TaxID=664909 RepID=A0ABS4H1S8_9BACL|nr:GNAT family N-acetyltransferase [Paenibacillus sediminis]MBP1936489.1 ribosomal-protein-alanine N-acetyltransferase [Paenibacillus sediminis]
MSSNSAIERITTDRLVLKVLNEQDHEMIVRYLNRNKHFLKEWEPIRKPEYFTASFQSKLLADEYNQIINGQLFKVWIFLKDDEEEVIGSVSLNNIVRGAFQSCHVGYRLDHQHLNKGYMTEALKAVIEHAFVQMNLHRLEANIMPRNLASLQVVQKLGFQHEGLAKQYLNINGVWEDHIHMVLLNESYRD